MASYVYHPLDTAKDDIRLVDVLPSVDFDAPIHLSILHAPFAVPSKDVLRDRRQPLTVIDRTLPPGWFVDKTLEGRFIYYKTAQDVTTKWEHPTGLDFGDPPPCPPVGFEPAYEALSYAWGEQHDREAAHVTQDERGAGGVLWLGRNLAGALRQLRQPADPRRMWIDSICINQEDLDERSQQVLRMKDIYQLAERVVMWLGPNASLAMDGLERVADRLETTKRYFLPRPGHQDAQYDWKHITCEVPFSDRMWESASELFARPWFKRVWTIQESDVANSKSILQCGDTVLLYGKFLKACASIATKAQRAQYTGPQLPQLPSFMAVFKRNCLSGRAFSDVLCSIPEFACSDPRDRVYGILGLMPQRIASSIQPEYTSSVSEVYKQAVLRYALAGGRLRLLDHCNIASRLPDAPSWVPNWMTSPKPWAHRSIEQWASGWFASRWMYTSPDILRVDGIRQGAITAVSPALESGERMVDFIRRAYMGEVSGVSKGRHLKDYAYLFNSGFPHPSFPTSSFAKDQLLDHILGKADATWPQHIGAKIFSDGSAPPRMIFVEGDIVGIAAGVVQPGDLVTVILGCRMPKVLRPILSSPTGEVLAYELLGSCEIPNLSNAEALLGPLPPHYTWEYSLDNARVGQLLFHNQTENWVSLLEDPRLGELPPEWLVGELSGEGEQSNEGFPLREFINIETGEVTRLDPRCTREALEARGVKLETFELR